MLHGITYLWNLKKRKSQTLRNRVGKWLPEAQGNRESLVEGYKLPAVKMNKVGVANV